MGVSFFENKGTKVILVIMKNKISTVRQNTAISAITDGVGVGRGVAYAALVNWTKPIIQRHKCVLYHESVVEQCIANFLAGKWPRDDAKR